MAGSPVYNVLGKCVLMGGCAFILMTAIPVAQITLGAVYVDECPAAPLIPVYVMVCGILALLLMGLLALPKLLCPAGQCNTIWTLGLLSLVLFAFVWFLFGSYHIYSVYPPNYTKTTIDPNSLNNSSYPPTAPDSKTGLTLENHNQSLPDLNQTWVINNNQTLRNLIKTSALRNISGETNGERLNAPQARRATAAAPYCNRPMYLFTFWTTTLIYVLAGNGLLIFICIYGFMKIANKLTELIMA